MNRRSFLKLTGMTALFPFLPKPPVLDEEYLIREVKKMQGQSADMIIIDEKPDYQVGVDIARGESVTVYQIYWRGGVSMNCWYDKKTDELVAFRSDKRFRLHADTGWFIGARDSTYGKDWQDSVGMPRYHN
jgi:hypothetical protein